MRKKVTIPIQPDYLKNADIEEKNADIEEKNADIREMKQLYAGRLKANGNNKVTIEKMWILMDTFGPHTSFGRKDVIAVIECGHTAASRLLKNLTAAEVITPVKGQGKGKYRFKTNL